MNLAILFCVSKYSDQDWKPGLHLEYCVNEVNQKVILACALLLYITNFGEE